MFYFLSKTLNYLLTPAGWLFMALVVALLTRNPVRRRRAIWVGLSTFWLFGNSFLINELALLWEYEPVSVAAVREANQTGGLPIAVVLTGGMMNVTEQPEVGRPLLGREADRAQQAFYLYKTGVVQKIVISGGQGRLPFQQVDVNDEGEMTAEFLRMVGVRPEDILLEGKSRNTRENALFSAQLLKERFNTNRCILVTSASHMRRSVACFQKAGVQVIPFPANFLSGYRSFVPGELLLPHEQAFADSFYLLREIVGLVVYAVVGYV
ncbi:YdcF family protein [Fibrisoma montanum]|uniref:YdcF family protein n=1 Tax=Fibrisoma montanum TaxID=2305895 RepID=A0A418MI84_9BACT|nr:YdcF family protein [Fibrisoma montanum]RIV27126.1 YdcF family protein [Fibrisoma montanum]